MTTYLRILFVDSEFHVKKLNDLKSLRLFQYKTLKLASLFALIGSRLIMHNEQLQQRSRIVDLHSLKNLRLFGYTAS